MLLILSALLIAGCQAQRAPLEKSPTDALLTAHCERQNKKNRLHVLSFNKSTLNDKVNVHIEYIAYRRMSIDEVRKLLVHSADDLFQAIAADTVFQEEIGNLPVTSENLDFQITFCTAEGDFPDPPSVAYATLKNNSINYAYYDSLFGKFSEYEDVTETFEAASKIVKRVPAA